MYFLNHDQDTRLFIANVELATGTDADTAVGDALWQYNTVFQNGNLQGSIDLEPAPFQLAASSRVTTIAGAKSLAFSGRVPVNDPDSTAAELTFAAELKAGETSYGTLVMATDGSYTFTPDAGLDASAGALTSTYAVTVTDEGGRSDTEDMTITIEANVAPVIVVEAVSDLVIHGFSFAGPAVVELRAMDTNSYDEITFTLGTTGDVNLFEIDEDLGVVRLKPVDRASFTTPDKGYYELDLIATDLQGASTTKSIRVNIAEEIDAPNENIDDSDETNDLYDSGPGADTMIGRQGAVTDRFLVETAEGARAVDIVKSFNAGTGINKIVVEAVDGVDVSAIDLSTITAEAFKTATNLSVQQLTETTPDTIHKAQITWTDPNDATNSEVVMIVESVIDNSGDYDFGFTDFELI